MTPLRPSCARAWPLVIALALWPTLALAEPAEHPPEGYSLKCAYTLVPQSVPTGRHFARLNQSLTIEPRYNKNTQGGLDVSEISVSEDEATNAYGQVSNVKSYPDGFSFDLVANLITGRTVLAYKYFYGSRKLFVKETVSEGVTAVAVGRTTCILHNLQDDILGLSQSALAKRTKFYDGLDTPTIVEYIEDNSSLYNTHFSKCYLMGQTTAHTSLRFDVRFISKLSASKREFFTPYSLFITLSAQKVVERTWEHDATLDFTGFGLRSEAAYLEVAAALSSLKNRTQNGCN